MLAVLTHQNLPRIAGQPQLLPSLVGGPAPGESFFPMQDDVVHYAGQPVAIVVADTLERAAARGVPACDVSYETRPVDHRRSTRAATPAYEAPSGCSAG